MTTGFSNSSSSPSYYDELLLLNLPFYNSTESLTLRIYDYSNFYLLPTICVFGIITSTINVFILAKTGVKENIHLYMLIGSVSDLSFLLIQVFIAIFRCGTLCPYGYKYASKVYELYIYLYLGYAIVTFAAFVDISVSIDRILLFSSNSKIGTRTRFAIRCVILFIVSALLVMPDYALAREIIPIGILVHTHDTGNSVYYTYEILYSKTMRKAWLQPALQIPLTVLSLAKGPALIALVFIVDLIVIYKFNQHLKKKKLISKSSQSREERKENRESNRATQMIISVSLLYFIGNVEDSFASIIELFGVDLYNDAPLYSVIGNIFLFGSHGLYIFIYYYFDKQYNNLFQRLILRRKTLVKMAGTTEAASESNRKSTIVVQSVPN